MEPIFGELQLCKVYNCNCCYGLPHVLRVVTKEGAWRGGRAGTGQMKRAHVVRSYNCTCPGMPIHVLSGRTQSPLPFAGVERGLSLCAGYLPSRQRLSASLTPDAPHCSLALYAITPRRPHPA